MGFAVQAPLEEHVLNQVRTLLPCQCLSSCLRVGVHCKHAAGAVAATFQQAPTRRMLLCI